MVTKSFGAKLATIRDKTKEQMRAVLSHSVQDVMDVAQTPTENGGNMPVLDGYLINSVVSELNGAIVGQASEAEDKGGGQSSVNIALVVAEIAPGDVARFGWTAAHAMRQHEGFVGEDELGREYDQGGKFWIDGAAAEWQKIVEANVGKLK